MTTKDTKIAMEILGGQGMAVRAIGWNEFRMQKYLSKEQVKQLDVFYQTVLLNSWRKKHAR